MPLSRQERGATGVSLYSLTPLASSAALPQKLDWRVRGGLTSKCGLARFMCLCSESQNCMAIT